MPTSLLDRTLRVGGRPVTFLLWLVAAAAGIAPFVMDASFALTKSVVPAALGLFWIRYRRISVVNAVRGFL